MNRLVTAVLVLIGVQIEVLPQTCTFTLAEVQGAFALLASQLTAQGMALR